MITTYLILQFRLPFDGHLAIMSMTVFPVVVGGKEIDVVPFTFIECISFIVLAVVKICPSSLLHPEFCKECSKPPLSPGYSNPTYTVVAPLVMIVITDP